VIGLLKEFWEFLREDKKLWLLPIVVILVVIGMALTSGGTLAPFIYALF
jgi:hypothetical protein